jgi:hypothetical protein
MMMQNNPIDAKTPVAMAQKAMYIYSVLKEPLLDYMGVKRVGKRTASRMTG